MADKKTIKVINTYRTLPDELYSYEQKRDFKNAEMLLFNKNLAEDLSLAEFFCSLSDKKKAWILSGTDFIDDAIPISQAYAGHQFGYFNILGDGRALLIAEILTPDGEVYDIHLKGSGNTVYSRGGDGLASLDAMLREYLISEAMYSLNIPSTRSLSVVRTGEKVYRNKFIDGAILARVAKSHIRVGTFSYAGLLGEHALKQLADYSIKRHYKELTDTEEKYQKFLSKVIDRQAFLIAKWVANGFIHGVMNTDNMLISGETIDYGPCAFLDVYDSDTVFSSIDTIGRYRYSNQKKIGLWNLTRFAEAMLPLLDKDKEKAIEKSKKELDNYNYIFSEYFYKEMLMKLGLKAERPEYRNLVDGLLGLMYINKADYTNTFIRLTCELMEEDASYLDLTKQLFDNEDFKVWKGLWMKALKDNNLTNEEVWEDMKKVNPFIIPRNEIVEHVLKEAKEGDMSGFNEFLNALKKPFEYIEENKKYQKVNESFSRQHKTYCGT